ncbi:MAG: hypothetical protein WBB94_04770 [Candidatus Saccharimonadaceae bacterium]
MNAHAPTARSDALSVVRNMLVVLAAVTVTVLLLSLTGQKLLIIAGSAGAVLTVLYMSLSLRCDPGTLHRHSSGTALRRFLYHSIEPDHIDPCKS